MNNEDKINYLRSNHFTEYSEARRKSEDEVSDSQPVQCSCGRLATGLHESRCSRYQAKVVTATIKKLKHLLPVEGE